MTLDDLVPRLKRVRRSGSGYVALCPAHNDRHHSLSLRQGNDRILVYCHAGCTVGDFCDALGIQVRDLFGGGGSLGCQNTHYTGEQRLKYARRVWQATRPASGTVVENYLCNRGITVPIPPAIRLCYVTCEEYPPNMDWPALTAGIQDVAGTFTGVSITALCADGSDKMPVEEPRRIYGPYRGGAVRLSNQLDDQLAVGEGIETMMSVMQATGIPSWAALSASNLVHVQIPRYVCEVQIFTDADRRGEAAGIAAAQRLASQGLKVMIVRPPWGAKDFNDVLL